MPLEAIRWRLVMDTGWTLEYVDALSLGDLQEYFQVMDGMNKGRSSLFTRPKKGR
jgi:hypothetical protein